jgi:hypothetical protein
MLVRLGKLAGYNYLTKHPASTSHSKTLILLLILLNILGTNLFHCHALKGAQVYESPNAEEYNHFSYAANLASKELDTTDRFQK